MSYYYLKEESVFPSYLQFPEFLMNLPISQTAKITYMVLYDRARLSQKNKWLDEENRVYIVYSLDDIQSDMNVSKHKAIDCLSELEDVGLIVRRKRGKGLPNQIYVKNFSKAQVVASV